MKLVWCQFRLTHCAYIIYLPTKCTLLDSTNIKRASSTCFGTCVPSSGRIQCHFLETKCYCEGVIYRILGLQQLCRWQWSYVKGITVLILKLTVTLWLKTFLILKQDVYTVLLAPIRDTSQTQGPSPLQIVIYTAEWNIYCHTQRCTWPNTRLIISTVHTSHLTKRNVFNHSATINFKMHNCSSYM